MDYKRHLGLSRSPCIQPVNLEEELVKSLRHSALSSQHECEGIYFLPIWSALHGVSCYHEFLLLSSLSQMTGLWLRDTVLTRGIQVSPVPELLSDLSPVCLFGGSFWPSDSDKL